MNGLPSKHEALNSIHSTHEEEPDRVTYSNLRTREVETG